MATSKRIGWGLLPLAADRQGLVALPDINDTVLVLLIHEDPGEGVVLGGLYGQNGPPDSGVENGVVRRYTLLTRGGQRIRLDDENDIIRVETHNGSYFELSPRKLASIRRLISSWRLPASQL